MYRLVYSDYDMPTFEIEEQVLDPLGVEIVLAASSDEDTLAREVKQADVLMAGYAPITAAIVEAAAAGRCRAIVRNGIGYDNIDVATAVRHGIPVANVPDYCVNEVADHTMSMLLAFARRLIDVVLTTRSGGWEIPRDSIPRLAGRKLALIGVGRIGRRVASRAQAFDLVVEAFDPARPGDVPGVAYAESPEDLVRDADYISIHAPLTAETHHMVDSRMIDAMRHAPLLINNSRGGLVDLNAVTKALHSGQLSGVALDVFEVEPLSADHPLRSHPHAILTPHMSYYSNESEHEVIRRSAEEVARALRGEPLLNPVTELRVPRTLAEPGA